MKKPRTQGRIKNPRSCEKSQGVATLVAVSFVIYDAIVFLANAFVKSVFLHLLA